MKKSLDFYIKQLEAKYPNEYLVLTTNEEYENLNSHSKIKIKHLKCNTIFEKSFHGLLRDEKCTYCSARTGSIEKYQKYLDDTFGKNEYKIISDTYNSKSPLKIKHLKCNTTWDIKPSNIKSLKSCPTCKINNLREYSNNKKYDINDIKNMIESVNGYKLISDVYNGNKDKLKILHETCGNIFEIKFNNFQQGYRCSMCSKRISNSELRVIEYLKSLNIDFIHNAIFNDCKYIKLLRFDFKINYDNSFLLIECDGKQHFHECLYNKDMIQNKRDFVKDTYCKENNIKLYRIPYTKFKNIEDEIKNILIENKIL